MNMVGKILLLANIGWTQSVRSHFPIDHTSVRLTQTHPKYWPKLYTTRPGDQEKGIQGQTKKINESECPGQSSNTPKSTYCSPFGH